MKTLCLILFSYVSLSADSFDAQLEKYLAEKFASYKKFDYQLSQMPKSFSKLEINTAREFRLAKNYAYVPVIVYDKKKFPSQSFLTVKVKLYKEVLVANEKINQNTALNYTMFGTRLEDVSLYSDKVVDVKNIAGKRSKVPIKSGSILTSDMVEQIPVVFKGDKIVIHSGRNGVDISVDAISRQDGCIGEVISVQSNNKIFKAKVIDKFNLTLVE